MSCCCDTVSAHFASVCLRRVRARARARMGVVLGLMLIVLMASPVWAQQISEAPSLARLTADAEAGNAQAQADLAALYHDGQVVVQNYAVAADWARRAAQAGIPAAQNLLGKYHHAGLGVARDQQTAIRWLGAAAASGDPTYLFDLGTALENGVDGSSDLAGAVQAYRAASQAGSDAATVALGVMTQEGRGVPQDLARARALYQGPAEAGDAQAQNNLGLLYVRGQGGAQDYARAAALFSAAAEQGLAVAMSNLSVMYANGFGVPFDEDRAAALLRAAKGQDGNRSSQLTLADLIYDPRLAPPIADDEGQNSADLIRAADAGDPVAAFQLGWLLSNTPAPAYQDLRRAALLFRAGAEAGHGAAMLNLGVMHAGGIGVLQDFEQALMWLTLAQTTGQTIGQPAQALAARIAQAMTPAQINAAQASAARAQHTKKKKL